MRRRNIRSYSPKEDDHRGHYYHAHSTAPFVAAFRVAAVPTTSTCTTSVPCITNTITKTTTIPGPLTIRVTTVVITETPPAETITSTSTHICCLKTTTSYVTETVPGSISQRSTTLTDTTTLTKTENVSASCSTNSPADFIVNTETAIHYNSLTTITDALSSVAPSILNLPS